MRFAPLPLVLAACFAADSGRVAEVARGDVVVLANGPTEPLRAPATYVYAGGSTVRFADNRFDSFAIEAMLRETLERHLRERGLDRARSRAPDYVLGYRLTSGDFGDITDAVRTMGLRPRFGGDPEPLPRGALLVALSDARTRDVIWRATIEGAVDPTHTDEESRERIELAVELLLERLDGGG